MPVDLRISLLLQIARSFARVSAYSSFRGTQSSASNWVFIFLGGVVQPINWYIPTTASPASVVHSTWMTSPLSSPSQILASLGFSIMLLTVLLEAIGKRIAADWSIQGQADLTKDSYALCAKRRLRGLCGFVMGGYDRPKSLQSARPLLQIR